MSERRLDADSSVPLRPEVEPGHAELGSARHPVEADTHHLATCQRAILDVALSGAPLDEVFQAVAVAARTYAGRAAGAVVLESAGTSLVCRAAAGAGHCGATVFELAGDLIRSSVSQTDSSTPCLVRDVLANAGWQPYQTELHSVAVRAVWCFPILTTSQRIVGVLVVSHPTPCDPAPGEIGAFALFAQLAGLISTQHRTAAALQLSEERFRRASDAAAALVYDIDLRRGTSLMLHGLEAVLGVAADGPSSSDSWRSHMHPDDRLGHEQRLQEALAGTATRWSDSYRVRHADGGWRDVDDAAEIVRGADGQARRLIGAIVDVTARQSALRHLRASDERQAFLLRLNDAWRGVDDPVLAQTIATRLLGRHLAVSRAVYATVTDEGLVVEADFASGVASLTGTYAAADAVRAWPVARPPDHTAVVADVAAAPELTAEQRAAWTTLGVEAFLSVGLVRDGGCAASLAVHSATPRAWTSGERDLVREVVDRTWTIVTRLQVDKAKRDSARELARQKDEFIAVLAHELRNPLAPVRTAVGVLRQRGGLDPVAMRCRDIIDRQVGHLARLLDDLLDVSRLSRGVLQLRREPVALAALLAAAVEATRPYIATRRHTLATRNTRLPVVVDGDPTRLIQVFSILLDNAARYTEPGGRLQLVVSVRGKALRVMVRDSGMGVPPELQDRIFGFFAHEALGPVRHRSSAGLGVGLALARRLVELHGGRLTVRSAGMGRGSTFTVTLATGVSAASGTSKTAEAAVASRQDDPAEGQRSLRPQSGGGSAVLHPQSPITTNTALGPSGGAKTSTE